MTTSGDLPPMADAVQWPGRVAVDAEGRRLGKLDEIYVEPDGRAPRWAVVDTGTGDQPRSFVPLSGARVEDEAIRVAYPRETVLAAAVVRPGAELSTADEQRLGELYGLVDEVELTLSEEQLRVDAVRRPAGRVRLRKVVVTEDVTLTVTLRREEVRLEHLPAPTGDAAAGAGEITDTEDVLAEVTLYEEVPVVAKQVVPRERVRVTKAARSEEREVTEPVRSERVELLDETTDPGAPRDGPVDEPPRT